MQRMGDSPRHAAAQTALQIHGLMDPDTSRDLADHVVFAVDRMAFRGSYTGGPTRGEIRRGVSAFERQGISVTNEQMYGALLAALCPGLIDEAKDRAS